MSISMCISMSISMFFVVVEHIITEDCKIVKIIEYAFYVWISSSQIKE